jgi:hypothetical protein
MLGHQVAGVISARRLRHSHRRLSPGQARMRFAGTSQSGKKLSFRAPAASTPIIWNSVAASTDACAASGYS